MIFNVIGFVIGILILIAGIYYFVKEKDDKESRKIYGITTAAGTAVTVFVIVRFLLEAL